MVADCRTLSAGRCPKPPRGEGKHCKFYNAKYLCYYIDYREFAEITLGVDGGAGAEGGDE